MSIPGSFHNGFAPRDGQPLYPELWRGCVGAWAPCLGPTGVTLRDWSGYSRHGALTSVDPSVAWVPLLGRYGLLLDGVNDFINLSSVVQSFPFSLSFWIRPASLGSDRRLFSPSAGSASQTAIRIDTSTLQIINAPVNAWLNLATGITANTLIHVAINLTSSSTQAWVNGIENAAVGPSGGISSNFAFGSPYLGNGKHFSGHVDDMRINSRLLTPSEIRLLASRRGIAYDMAPRKRTRTFAGFKAYWAARKAQILGGGL